MKLRTLFLLLILGAIAAFSALNWGAFSTPTTLSLSMADVQAPLGVIMLGVIAFLTAFFLIFVVYVQAWALLESRRHAQELQVNRELADRAEARASPSCAFSRSNCRNSRGPAANRRSPVKPRSWLASTGWRRMC